MGRNILLSLLPATLILSGWGQLERPSRGGQLILVALLGVLATQPRRVSLRLAAVVAASLFVVDLAFGLLPVRGALWDVWNGTIDYYEVTLPFDPFERERMHGVVLLAVFGFSAAAALAIAQRRAILASAVTFAGAAWPVTLIRDAPSTARGALLLAAALLLLAALRPGPRPAGRQGLVVGGAVVVAAMVAVSSPAVAKGAFLNWERWEPYTRPENPVDVSYVWDANYKGIEFPKKSTTVLTVKAPPQAPYWRATTLDAFVDDHWRQDAYAVEPVDILGRDALVEESLAPPKAWLAANWMHQEVTVQALRDTHLVAATVPVAFQRGAAPIYSAGVAHVGRLRRGQTYEAWSYVERPTPRQLARSQPKYPSEIAERAAFLETPAGFAPLFGAGDRDAGMRTLIRRRFGDPTYNRLYTTARRVVGRPRSPYAAVIALEAWFRQTGNFIYDETPPQRRGVPPLVAFVTQTKRGYCQHFAGAMALMLRYLGIPARVGAGFTTGRYNEDKGEWTVSDTNAHTWVEVWFDGYGWLPFDPTPGRGRLLSSYTSSSTFFDASGATSALAGVGATALGLDAVRDRLEGGGGGDNTRAAGGDQTARKGKGARGASDDGGSGSLIVLLLLLTGGMTAALWLLKVVRRQVRYVTRDPRRLAGAVRLDLVDFLVDQRVPVASSATPAEVGEELERSIGIPADRLAEALAEARYGPAAGAESAAHRARRELRFIRRTIRRRLGIGERLRGLLSLRSLGLGAG
ncbi:MAG TPA: transglutaminaseTgpA domain-containing protein [Gaiellaceae bacterium]|nr:transglutaminaseTgpA domain-containing protein [Gaiellaceae bacterium]